VSGAAALAERALREACGDRLRTGFPLAPLTTLRVGGPARLFLDVSSEDDLRAVAAARHESGIEVLVVGKGSNLLVSDEGFDGLVLRLGRAFRWSAHDGDRLTAGAAMPLPALAGVALRHRLSGLEFSVAIPASVGGAVWMNAGAHGGEMADVVEGVELFVLDRAERVNVPGAEAGFSYRRSRLPASGVVIAATVRLAPGSLQAIRDRMQAGRDYRRRTQPLAEATCGSVFKNPEGDHAARIIEAAGLKGTAVGGVRVSETHANFIVASPGARAADVLTLIRLVQTRVRASTGIALEPEVHLVGAFPGA
jgi:UDP-N-acetylmuramate dehydrogenase